ncbi:MAG: T9SS type A sorting domain-containing protein [Candidatus Eisenbacteria bacterium]|nr:T9SS type A sorting domain-containing protein [Candidatus Eisenbacteria bacterium]
MSVSPRIGRIGTARGCAAIALSAAALLALVPNGAVATTTADDVVAVLEFDASQLGFDFHDGYDVVTLEGADFMTEPDEPMLPALNVQILLPPDEMCVEVRAVTGATVPVPGTFSILPAPRPARFSSVEAAKDPQPNTTTYDSVLPFPREVARLVGDGTSRGYGVASIIVSPLSYVPATGELALHRRIELRVATEAREADGSRRFAGGGRAATASLESSVLNASVIGRYTAARSGRDDTLDYLVICPESLVSEFERLAEWKTRKGVPAEVVSLDDIAVEPVFAGADLSESIRNCIDHYVTTYGVEWILLGGDTDAVPARNAYDFFFEQGIPCDLYYSDLDGTWDDDGDGRWGEVDEDSIDMFSDVFVGRAPVSSLDGAASFVDKVLSYEGASFAMTTDYQLRMLYLGEILWDSPDPYTDGAVACEMIDDDYVPPRFDPAEKLYQSEGTLDRSSSLGELNSGYGIVMHEGHADISRASIGADELTNATLDGLTNGDRGGVWYSVGCWSAAIDHDTFGEHWISNPEGGGVAYVGNSRYGWGCPGYPGQCVSDLYSQQFFNSLFVKELVHAGTVHADAKHYYVGLAKIDDYMRYAMYELNLLGDPEMPIWTDTPLPLDVTADVSVDASGVAEVAVNVRRGGAAEAGARVCLWNEAADIYEVVATDAAGTALISLDAEAADSAELTVTSMNSIPHGETLNLGGATGVEDGAGRYATALLQNYPNPFNPRTTIAFALSERTPVRISVYDVTGRAVTVLVDDELEAGHHSVAWDGRDASGNEVASGTYFARMSAGRAQFENKMILMR